MTHWRKRMAMKREYSWSLIDVPTFGSVLAMIISWSINHSILWAIIHGVCSWLYVIYYALGYGR